MKTTQKQGTPTKAGKYDGTKPCQIFLIEDDADDRILARRELEKSPLVENVATFSDGLELTDYMERQGFMDHSVIMFDPLLILIDLEMPRKNGFQVLKELKSDPFLAEIPMVVITANQSREKMFEAFRLGADGLFQKPINHRALEQFFSKSWQWPPADMWN